MKNERKSTEIFIFTSLDIKWLVKAREKTEKFSDGSQYGI
jgi:hypothetical protein